MEAFADIETVKQIIKPFVQYFSALVASGFATSVAVQLLKLDWFPVAVSKYPRITNVIVSVVSSVAAIWLSGVNFIFVNWLDYVGFGIGTLVLSALTYRTLLKGTIPAKDGKSVEKVGS